MGHGVTRVVTVLFADVRGFTRMAASRPPQEVVAIMNRFYQASTDILLQHDACVDKFMGDQIMVVFNSPITAVDHADQALESALAIDEAAQRLPGLEAGTDGLPVGMSIHTGEAVLGHVGSEEVKDFTAMGATVNTGARLQRYADAGDILVTEAASAEMSRSMDGYERRQVEIPGTPEMLNVAVVRNVGRHG